MPAYNKAVEADSPLFYWPMEEASGELAPAKGAGKIKLTNGPTYRQTGAVKGGLGAISFDGTNDFGQVALDLSAQSAFTVEFLINWTTNANDDDFAMEHSATANTNPGFNVDWNSSADGGGTASVKWRESEGQNRRYTFVRPSAGAWHHVVLVLTINGALVAYVDGVSVTVTARETEVQANKFPSTTLNLFSRNGASLFGKGKMEQLAFYSGALSKAQVEAHFKAVTEEEGKGEAKSGTSSISATATVSATGSAQRSSSSAISASGSASAQGIAARKGSSQVSVASSATASGSKSASGSSSLSAVSSCSASGSRSGASSSSVTASCSVSASGSKGGIGSSSISGSGAVSAAGSKQAFGTSTITAAVVVTAVGEGSESGPEYPLLPTPTTAVFGAWATLARIEVRETTATLTISEHIARLAPVAAEAEIARALSTTAEIAKQPSFSADLEPFKTEAKVRA
jgi:hypothetical protein